MKRTFIVASLALALGCSASSGSGSASPGGKADGLGPQCSFDTAFAPGDDSQELADHVVAGREVSVADVDDLTATEVKQLIAAGVQLEFFESDATLEDAFDAADEGLIEIIELEVDDGGELVAYDWIRYFAGDNEVGVVFDDDTRTVVAEISDGDVLGCVQVPPAAFVCSFDEEFVGGESSEDLEFFLVGGLEFTAADQLTPRQLDQLAVVAEQAEIGTSLFEHADEGTVEFLDLEVETVNVFVAADWIRYFAGDTEVGYVFEIGTTNLIAEVSDGDVLSCVAQ
ncbi:MAG: hypothetical protein KJO07_02705 [Deltaproteobacteria bacterium]|nr:hypothetical protein [Deltaproteobacteria bacterium]